MIIDLAEQSAINFGATGIDEVLQNIRTIVSTPAGSVPIIREFGVDYSMLDEPMPIVKAKLSSILYAVIKQYEPRATVAQIVFHEQPADGVLVPIITISEVIL